MLGSIPQDIKRLQGSIAVNHATAFIWLAKDRPDRRDRLLLGGEQWSEKAVDTANLAGGRVDRDSIQSVETAPVVEHATDESCSVQYDCRDHAPNTGTPITAG